MMAANGISRVFQFPSNGKAETKSFLSPEVLRGATEFQFPSNGKVYPKGIGDAENMRPEIKFQFPSNGKAETKVLMVLVLFSIK